MVFYFLLTAPFTSSLSLFLFKPVATTNNNNPQTPTNIFLSALSETEQVTFIVSVGTADYCGQVIANVDVAGSLSVYGDASHTTEKHVWSHLLQAHAYFKGTFTSPSVSLFMVRLDTVTATVHSVSGWVNTVTLYSSGVVTSLGTSVEFTVPAPYLTDVYFEFDVAHLFDTMAAPINSTMTVTAMVTIGFSSSQGKRHLESAYLISSQRSKRIGSNTRSLITDTTLYLGVQQQQPQQTGGPLPDTNREGEEANADGPSSSSPSPVMAMLYELLFSQGSPIMRLLATMVALLLVVVLILHVIKQFKAVLLQ